MRFGAVATMTVSLAAGFMTLVPGCQLIETRNDASASGGSTTSSGGRASGGSSSGGTVASGGSSAKGGAGGSSSSGGASGGEGGAGGTVASGGIPAKGGAGGAAGGSGGTFPDGGNTTRGGNGGTGPLGNGGNTARGGSGGGSTVVSNCTDTPPADRTETCAQWVSYNVCSQSWFATYCDKSCGRCAGTSQGGAGGNVGGGGSSPSSGGAGGVSGPGTTNPPITGTPGWASRYWDCCKPSCGWTANSNPPVPSCGKDGKTRVGADQRNGCEGGGTAFECYDFHPWYDAATNMAYGFAAKNGVSCGACFMLQFTGDSHNGGANPGAATLKGQQMVVQAINIGGIESNQFDLLIPGGGVGAMNGCSTQWGSSTELGVQYGGLLATCKADPACMKGKCQSVFGNMPDLKAGCDWFTSWFASADNPNLIYKQVSCPEQLKSKTGISR